MRTLIHCHGGGGYGYHGGSSKIKQAASSSAGPAAKANKPDLEAFLPLPCVQQRYSQWPKYSDNVNGLLTRGG